MCLRVSYKKKIYKKNIFFASLKSLKKGVRSGVGFGVGFGLDPLVRGRDSRIRTNMSRIPNTALKDSKKRRLKSVVNDPGLL